MPVGTEDIFFIFLVLKLNCSFPKIYHQKCNIILRVFFHFCLFVLCFCLFVCFLFCFCSFFPFGLFVVILLFCDKHYVSNRLHTKLINATSHCRHHEKSRRGHLFHLFFNVPYFKPRDSYVYNFCRFKKKRKTTFNHLFLIALCLELVLTKPSGKQLPTLFYSKIGLGTFCSLKMKIKYFF